MSDIVVCGVTGDIVLEDIAFSVPKGHAVTISADLAVRSKDLYRCLSTGAIFQLNVNSLLNQRAQAQTPPAPPSGVQERNAELEGENAKFRGEVQRLQLEVSKLQAESGRHQAENSRLRAENVKLQDTTRKLDGILDLLKERPLTAIQQVGSQAVGSTPKTVEEGAAPTFIPSQIRSDNVTASRISLQEESSGSGGVSKASELLRKLKKPNDSNDSGEKQSDQ